MHSQNLLPSEYYREKRLGHIESYPRWSGWHKVWILKVIVASPRVLLVISCRVYRLAVNQSRIHLRVILHLLIHVLFS